MLDKKKKRERIIESARELFSRFGFLKTTVNEIARYARMGKATLYYYFGGKEEIFKEVLRRESEFIKEKIKKSISREESFQDKMRVFVKTKMECLNEAVNFYQALKNEYLDNYTFIVNARRKNFLDEIEIIKSILRDGIQQNVLAVRDVESTAFAIVSFMKGLEYKWAGEIPMPRMEENINRLMEILFFGLMKRE